MTDFLVSKELEDLMRQYPSSYPVDPLLPTESTSTLAALNPVNFSEAIPDITSLSYSDLFTTPLSIDESYLTNFGDDSAEPSPIFPWDVTSDDMSFDMESWDFSAAATLSPDALAELESLISSVDQFLAPPKEDLQMSIEDLDRELSSDNLDMLLTASPFAMDESNEQ